MNAPQIDGPESRFVTPLRLAAAAWLVGFTVYFFSQALPNAGFTRPAFWRESPWLILDSLLPPVPVPGQPVPDTSGWRFLPQRFNNIAWAALVLAGSWHLGAMLLRAVLQPGALRRGSVSASAAPPLSPGVHLPLAGLAGLSAWSLVVLGLGLMGVLSRPAFIGLLAGFIGAEWFWERRRPWRLQLIRPGFWSSLLDGAPRLATVCLLAMAPFCLAILLGALLPSVDFDVKAYHLVGPKEWFQTGQITFLPYNVYTSFPFLTEMQLLSSMVVRGDWFEGALAGQLVLAAFGVYAAIAVFHLAARFSRAAGWFAAFVYLTTPWVCRISIIAYVEGALAAYLAAALFCFLESRSANPRALRWTAFCGLFAGSAAACKYPGVLSALIPFGGLSVWQGYMSSPGTRLRSAFVNGAVFSAAGLAAFGPWLLKNLAQTGNPVYPLLWSLFGGRAFDAALNEKFKAGHALPVDVLKNPLKWIPDLWRHLWDVAVGSDWQSPLMFGLAPAAGLVWWSLRSGAPADAATRRRSGDLAMLMLFAVWLFVTWWALTHRIDRFWVPMLPIVAALSGVALAWILTERRGFTLPLIAVLAATTWYHLAFVASPLIGFNGYLMDQTVARRIAETPGMTIINSLPEGSRTLLIGEAQVFEARRPVIYSTVFNHNIFEQLFRAPGEPPALLPREQFAAVLRDRGITHVLVNWNEVLRYRTTYGYSDFVTPENVSRLKELGLVERMSVEQCLPLSVRDKLPQRVRDKGDSTRFQLSDWGQKLVRPDPEGDWYPAYELWRVIE